MSLIRALTKEIVAATLHPILEKRERRYYPRVPTERVPGSGRQPTEAKTEGDEKKANEPARPREKRKSGVEPYIRRKDYGIIRLKFKPRKSNPRGGPAKLVTPEGEQYCYHDSEKHVFCFGGSGSGKTYYFLDNWIVAYLRAGHLPPGKEREELKPAVVIIEANGDYRDKLWYLAKRFDRVEDAVYFGPAHPNVKFNFFHNRDELPMVRAGKMLELMKAYEGPGTGGKDPFWDTKATHLFSYLFQMHKTLEEASARADTPEKAEKYKVPPMSFRLLSLLLMDRGRAENEDEVRKSHENCDTHASLYREATDRMVPVILRLAAEFARLERTLDEKRQEASRCSEELEVLQKSSADYATTVDRYQGLMEAVSLLAPVVEKMNLEYLLDRPGKRGASEALHEVAGLFEKLHTCVDDKERARYSNETATYCASLRQVYAERMAAVENARLNDLRGIILEFNEACAVMIATRSKVIKVQQSVVAPKYGALKQMLDKYEDALREMGVNPMNDIAARFFNGEYLDVANDRMSGSVAAVASTVANFLSLPPFDAIFHEEGTFNFQDVIDRGQMVYVDMPVAEYQQAAVIASLALKMEFFSTVLTRSRRFRPDGTQINQDRPILYFSDEFPTVASVGEYTGESGFLDKCRKYHCTCVLAAQNFNGLYRKLSEQDINSILANATTSLFLRNKDEKTREIASRQGGEIYKGSTNFTADSTQAFFAGNDNPQGRGYSTSYARTPRFPPDFFLTLEDGEGLLTLPPRFGPNAIQVVQLEGTEIKDPDGGKGLPVPGARRNVT
jgi:Type IV secretory pathway, VirD4 components